MRGDAGTLASPIDATQLSSVDFGKRSHWLQPWRAYLDTVPAQRLLDSIGINFNVSAKEAPATARLLAANGFKRARIEVGWSAISALDQTKLTPTAQALLNARIQALKANGIRPLILLNANDSFPCPLVPIVLNLTAPASAGARQIQLDSTSASLVVPGRTGLDSSGVAAATLITAVDPGTGIATLAEPLPAALSAGTYQASTLKYAPFAGPFLADGITPNPAFEDTLAGWLSYTKVVSQTVAGLLGNQSFDVEIWNELTNGSSFLKLGSYYNPLPSWAGTGDVTNAVLSRTVAYLRNPANGVSSIGIGNGFANTRPWDAGSTSPVGLTAIDKHPYPPAIKFPAGQVFDGTKPINAQGVRDGTQDGTGNWHDNFIPTYDAFFPEYYLTAIQTESLVRDLAPVTSLINNTAHGRNTAPAGGSPPTMWLTEINQDPRDDAAGLTAAQVAHIEAKIVLRTLVSYVNKGASATYLYAVESPKYAVVDPAFMASVDNGTDPGPGAGGPAVDAVKRLTAPFQGATGDPVQPLSLVSVTDAADHAQFAGDPSNLAAHPPLYDRNVLAFLPFQVAAGKFVVPVYVMTRNMDKVYNTTLAATDPARFDMPPETMTLTIGGLPNQILNFGLSDPLTGATVPVTVDSHSGSQWTVDVPVTDSPRLLTINSDGTAPTNVSAVAGKAQATVSWTPPTSNGGSALTGYTVTSSPGGLSTSVGPTTTSAVVTGLSAGTTYTFTVVARNALASSAPSAPSNAVTLAAAQTPPSITGLSRTKGRVGVTVTITGTNFAGATAVAFNGTAASFTVVSATSITTKVPSGATSGPISVTTPGGTATSQKFTVR